MSRLGILLCLLACVTLRVTCDEDTSQEPRDGLAAEDTLAEVSTLRMTRPLRNTTRDAGGSLKLRCEAEGEPGVTEFTWYKHNAPVITERRRIRIKTNTEERPAWSMLKISILETLDTGFYTCEASNGVDRVKSDAIVRVNLGTFGTLPKSFPPVEPNFPDGPTNIEFEGISPEMEQEAMKGMKKTKSNQLTDTMIKKLEKNNPSLVPNEQSGYCQQYHGTVCSQYIGSNYIYISEGLSHEYIERKLQGVFTAIAASQQMSPECAEFALPSICLSTFPICDQKTQKPRKICRDECEILAHDKCKSEHALARQHPLLAQQIVLPDCEELPPIGTRESEDCVELGIPLVDELILAHTCYTGDGAEYRGTASTTRSGHTCVPWAHQKEIQTVKHLELIGGHNYCRNPAGDYQDSRPWCYTNDDHITREVCAIRQCPKFNMWLYIAVPAVSAVAIIGLSIGKCKYCVNVNIFGRQLQSSIIARSLLYAEKASAWEADDHPQWHSGQTIAGGLRGPGGPDLKHRHSRDESPSYIKATATENEDTGHGDTFGIHPIYPGTWRGGIWQSVQRRAGGGWKRQQLTCGNQNAQTRSKSEDAI